MTDIVITAARRTAIGTFNGTLAAIPATTLGAHIIKTVLHDSQLNGADVDQIIMGQVLTAGAGQGPARQAALQAGIPVEKTALTVNQVCASGLRAVALAAISIQANESTIVVAGGQENMSLSPHAMHLRNGVKFGEATMQDTMITDGLWDVSNDYHMGITAENVAAQNDISRAQQDDFALASQQKAEAAIKAGRFTDEIAPYTIRNKKGDIVFQTDEHVRHGTTIETLQGLKPAFKPDGGTVTAGNASGLNDGAAAVVVMSRAEAEKRGLPPLARIVSYATVGVDPSVMGTGPIPASQAALQKAGWRVDDLDLIESNEAFAAQSCAVAAGLHLDMSKVNVNGGAIALGHPIGASGARCLVTLIHEMIKRDAKKGLVTLCVGGGMGIAMCIARD